MPRNYDTRNHQIFPRVEKIEIYYPASGVPSIIYAERNAVVLGERVNFLEGAADLVGMHINPPTFADRIPLIDPVTGQEIAGKTTSLQDVLLGITAVLRNDQSRRDAEAQASADAQAAAEAQAAANATSSN
jgi:hypothetical protein